MTTPNPQAVANDRIAKAATVSPATAPATTKREQGRISLSLPQPKLSVPEIPGYHLHWFTGDAPRIQQALKAGYEFVQPEEVGVISHSLGSNAEGSGNTDLGTRVSVVAGGVYEGSSEAARLYLMKIREEWWHEDQKLLADVNERIASTIRGEGITAPGQDNSNRYRGPDKAKRKTLFHPKT